MRRTYRTLYRLGITPWNQTAVPAPLAALVEGPPPLPPGRAVDLGCGTGEQARSLAQHSWSVTALDYIPEAILAATHNAPTEHITWRVADVTDPATVDPDGILSGTVTLLLDNGCLHGIPQQDRTGWADTVNTLAAPHAVLLVRAAPRRYRAVGPIGLNSPELTALLADRWHPEAPPHPGWHRYSHG